MCSLRFHMPDFGVIWHERYVDNRFILLWVSAPSSTVLMNFLIFSSPRDAGDTERCQSARLHV